MQDLIPKIPGGYVSVRLTPPPLNSIFPKPPPVPPPPEKYYAATAICKPSTPTTPTQHAYSDLDGISTDEDLQLLEFPRHSLAIVEKLGCGVFGELHLCETKGLRYFKYSRLIYYIVNIVFGFNVNINFHIYGGNHIEIQIYIYESLFVHI